MSPATSWPGANGRGGLNWYLSAMISVSGKLTPAALTAIRTCPLPSGLEGSSISFRLSGPPGVSLIIARIVHSVSRHFVLWRIDTMAGRPASIHARRWPFAGRKMAGLYFEELTVGRVFDHAWTRTVTEIDNVLFSSLTMNVQPLHLDEEFASKTEFGQRIVNSLFTLGLMIGITVNDTTLGTTVANLGMTDVRFPKPVFHGDTLRVQTTVVSVRESKSRPDAGIVEFSHIAINQRGETVAQCIRQALMRKKPKT